MAKKRKRFTFKKEPCETGLRAVGHPYQSVAIKRDGREVGTIAAPTWSREGWRVGLMINEASGRNCDWKWMFPKTFGTEQEARDWLNSDDFKEPKCGLRCADGDE